MNKLNSIRVKVSTKLVISFLLVDLIMMWSLYAGYNGADAMATAANPEEMLSQYGFMTAFFFIATLITTTGILVVVVPALKKSMKELKNASKAMALGKTDITLKKFSNDEFGDMIDDLQVIVNQINEQALVTKEVANGNLTADVEVKSEEDVMGNALKKMVSQTNYTMSNIRDAAYQVSTSSAQVASASEALAQGSTEQASAIEEITVSIADVAAKTKQNASQANAANELIGQAIEDVQKGNKEMQDMVVAMQEINAASESISKIIKVIDDIAFQTNILALNAAVEAARAGEAGQGFAVVAEEVRNLAAKSAAAAAETAELIENSIRKVQTGSKIANETAQALDEITKVVQKSECMIHEIAESSNYQATAIAQIDRAIEQVSQVVQTNSATSEECAAASLELSSQAATVRELVSVFKLDSTGTSGAVENKRVSAATNNNDSVICMQDGFGKY